jgi:NAD(P)-dependent dehydrogenase (short-subunit alcohol dehydrogenase family)
VLDINLGGVLTLARVAVLALLRRLNRGTAVPRGGVRGGHPRPAEPGRNCASKAGVAGFIRALAAELGGTDHRQRGQPRLTDTAMLAESARMHGPPGPATFGPQQPIDGCSTPPRSPGCSPSWPATRQRPDRGGHPRRRRARAVSRRPGRAAPPGPPPVLPAAVPPAAAT